MSCNYADGLSPYHDKGLLGLDEKFENKSAIAQKVNLLAKWINKAKHVVIHTGAGISTSAGIPDFRGPKGVWTLEAKGQKPDMSTGFNDAIPTVTHMAITRMVSSGKVKYVVSQNIDGLHLRSGLSRKFLSELHGNMFVEQCNTCNRQFVRNTAVPTVGQKCLNKACPTIKPNGRACRGRLHDTILDWEHNLPENDLAMGDFQSCLADLSIALGTTMQIVPSGTLPLYTKKAGGKLVIINLQPTKHDSKADLLIHGYVDEVLTAVMKQLSLKIPKYCPKNDPTKLSLSSDKYFEWTISDKTTQEMREIYEAKCGSKEAKKRLDMIDEDDIPLIDRKRKVTDEIVPPVTIKAKKESKREPVDDDVQFMSEKKGRGRPRKDKTPPAPVKFTIKKNVTPTKTKYEIVKPKVEKKPSPKKTCEIVKFEDESAVPDLEMICESDDEGPNVFTTNFRRYLYEDTAFKKEEKPDVAELNETDSAATTSESTLEKVVEVELDKKMDESSPMEVEQTEQQGSKKENDVEEPVLEEKDNEEIITEEKGKEEPVRKGKAVTEEKSEESSEIAVVVENVEGCKEGEDVVTIVENEGKVAGDEVVTNVENECGSEVITEVAAAAPSNIVEESVDPVVETPNLTISVTSPVSADVSSEAHSGAKEQLDSVGEVSPSEIEVVKIGGEIVLKGTMEEPVVLDDSGN